MPVERSPLGSNDVKGASPPSVRRLRADDWPAYRSLRLRALADSPDAFGSTGEVERVKPDEYWAGRLSSAATSPWQLPLVAEAGTALVGLVWGRVEPGFRPVGDPEPLRPGSTVLAQLMNLDLGNRTL